VTAVELAGIGKNTPDMHIKINPRVWIILFFDIVLSSGLSN
jgi:hypothetical protein